MIRWYDPAEETELPHRSVHQQVLVPVGMRMPQLGDELARLKIAPAALGLVAAARLAGARRDTGDASSPVAHVRCWPIRVCAFSLVPAARRDAPDDP